MIQKLKGTKDILPAEVATWQYVEATAKNIFERYGYKEIRTPIIESSELFQRSVGEQTDVVQKEMYMFEDKGGRSIALRPEGTAGIIRAYIENGMASLSSPQKMYYCMPMYRYENVQKGRQREFNQIGCELIGSSSYQADVEVMAMIDEFIKVLKINDITLNINSIGCPTCREEYKRALKAFIEPNLDKYCDDCKARFEKNPMRILDCKVEADKKMNENAPSTLDYLCEECSTHFEKVKRGLENLGIKYEIDKRLVRGLDYYTKTVFEFVSNADGLTVFGGGRYDKLIEELGGQETPAIGFACGEERLLDVLKAEGSVNISESKPKIFIAYIGEAANDETERIVKELRSRGIYAEKDIMERGLNAQFKYANKIGAEYVVTLGDDELQTRKVQLKNMSSGETTEIDLDEIANKIAML